MNPVVEETPELMLKPQRTDPDVSVIRRFVESNDEELFRDLVERYSGLVFSACQRVLNDRARAEEASQDTFCQLLRRGVYVKESLAGWLHTVATRTAINMLNRDVSRRRREGEYVDGTDDGELTWESVAPHIDAVLVDMPEDVRDLIVDHYMARKTQNALAEEHGISQATVSRRLEQGLVALRGGLRQRGFPIGAVALTAGMMSGLSAEASPQLKEELLQSALSSEPVPEPSGLTVNSGHFVRASVATVAVLVALAIATIWERQRQTYDAWAELKTELSPLMTEFCQALGSGEKKAIAQLHLPANVFLKNFAGDDAPRHYAMLQERWRQSIKTMEPDLTGRRLEFDRIQKSTTSRPVVLEAGEALALMTAMSQVQIWNDVTVTFKVDGNPMTISAEMLVRDAAGWRFLGAIKEAD